LADPQHITSPATGTPDPAQTELAPGEEPVATGTLFLMIVLLIIVAGIWSMLYFTLLSR
jgi:hypothetical protein